MVSFFEFHFLIVYSWLVEILLTWDIDVFPEALLNLMYCFSLLFVFLFHLSLLFSFFYCTWAKCCVPFLVSYSVEKWGPLLFPSPVFFHSDQWSIWKTVPYIIHHYQVSCSLCSYLSAWLWVSSPFRMLSANPRCPYFPPLYYFGIITSFSCRKMEGQEFENTVLATSESIPFTAKWKWHNFLVVR